jgi:hypothetical protein
VFQSASEFGELEAFVCSIFLFPSKFTANTIYALPGDVVFHIISIVRLPQFRLTYWNRDVHDNPSSCKRLEVFFEFNFDMHVDVSEIQDTVSLSLDDHSTTRSRIIDLSK